MTHIPLYPDQTDLNTAVRKEMRNRKKYILVQAATGFGKSHCLLEKAQAAQEKGKKSIITVPRKELLFQMGETFKEFGVHFSYVAAGHLFNPYASIHLCTIQTLIRRLDDVHPDIVFCDEVHYGSASLDTIIQHYKKEGSYVIGYSASPERTDGRGLGCWFDTMVKAPSIRWLIDNGRLSDYRIFAPNTPDLAGVKTTAGDYNKGQLSHVMEGDSVLVGDAVRHYKERADGKLNIVFCVSIKHSKMVAEKFCAEGIPAMHIDGETPDIERRKIIRDFATRKIKVLCNVDLLCFGFDLASAAGMDVTVECMSDLRPTKSLALQLQKWGRVLRKKDEPALIFDHAGNVARFGMPCEERDWTLEDRQTKRGGKADDTIAVRQCPECHFAFKPAPNCPQCGYEFPIQYRVVEEIDGELAEVTEGFYIPSTPEESKKMEDAMAKMIQNGVKKGMPRFVAVKWAAKEVSRQMRNRG